MNTKKEGQGSIMKGKAERRLIDIRAIEGDKMIIEGYAIYMTSRHHEIGG